MRLIAMLICVVMLGACGSQWQVEYQIDPSIPDYQQDVWEGAVARWNAVAEQELGAIVLLPGDQVTLTVYGDQPCTGPTDLGCDVHQGRTHFAWINWDRLEPNQRNMVAMHELGHALGLEDLPCFNSSIMCDVTESATSDVTESDLIEFRRVAAQK